MSCAVCIRDKKASNNTEVKGLYTVSEKNTQTFSSVPRTRINEFG